MSLQEEVNALIELVSKLKNERQYYKSQLKTLITDLTQMKESYGLQNLPWPKTPLLPDTPALHLPPGNHTPHVTGGLSQSQTQDQSTLPHATVNDNGPLADSKKQQGLSLKCPVLAINDVAASLSTSTSLGVKPPLVPNGSYYPRSFWVANVLGPQGGLDTSKVGGALKPTTSRADKHLMKPSKTRDSICTMMTSISLSSPTANLLNVEETNLGLLETLNPSTGYKTEDIKEDFKTRSVSHEDQQSLTVDNCCNGANSRNSPDSSIAQGYDNKGICEWLSQSEGRAINIGRSISCVPSSSALCVAEKEDSVPRTHITSASASTTNSNTAPIVSNPCLTANLSINQTTTQGNATNNLNNPPSGDKSSSLCCGVKHKWPVNNVLRNNITNGAQRPKSLTLAKRAASHDQNGGCYTKKTNFVFYI